MNRTGHRSSTALSAAALFAVHQATLIAILWGRRDDRKERLWYVPAVAGFTFLGVCFGYFHVCQTLGLATQWVFLIGFLPSWPIALPAAYRLRRDRRLPEHFVWAILSFSAYYWACGAICVWGLRL